MKTKILFLIFVSIVPIKLFSQEYKTGEVMDSITYQAISEAEILNTKGKLLTTTDQNGDFTIKGNIDTIKIARFGYKPKIVIINKNKKNTIFLSKTDYQLKQITVEAPAYSPIESITKLDLNLKPINTSQEALRVIPGLFIAQHEGGGKAEQIFLRGFDMDHGTDISINVDGMPVNMVSHAHGQGYSDLHFLIPEVIDHIEFEKGPYNTQYGDFQTGGFINFHTKDFLKHNRIQLEAGMFDTYRLLTMINLFDKNNKKESAYIATEYMMTDGFFDVSQNFNRLNSFFKYKKQLSNTTALTLETSLFNTRWDAAGLIPQRAVNDGYIDRFGEIDSCGGGQTHRNNLIINFSKKLSETSNILNLFYFSDYGFDLHSNFTFFLNDSINGDEIEQKENRKLYGYKLLYTKNLTKGNWTLTTNLGGGFRYDDINNIELSHNKNRYIILDIIDLGDIDETNLNAFAEEVLQNGSLVIKIGSRLDFFNFVYSDKKSKPYRTFNDKKSTFSPKITIAYSFNKNLQVYAKAGKGFHSNDARIIATTKTDILPIAYGSDAGIIFKPFKSAIINIAYWNLYMQQEFVFSGDDGTVKPVGKSYRQGIDFSSRVEILNNLYTKFDINYANPRLINNNLGIYLPLAPIWTSTGGIFLKTKQAIRIGVSYRYLGKRPADEFNNFETKPYTVFDASASYTSSHFEIGISIQNLFNVNWDDAQFETTSKLPWETNPVTDIDFTPGTPFNLKIKTAIFF